MKNGYGHWYFDLMANGFGWDPPCPGCAVPLTGYGDNNYKPIVANYDSDPARKADLAIQTPDGYWAIDFAADGFGTWNTYPFYYAGWGPGGGASSTSAGAARVRLALGYPVVSAPWGTLRLGWAV